MQWAARSVPAVVVTMVCILAGVLVARASQPSFVAVYLCIYALSVATLNARSLGATLFPVVLLVVTSSPFMPRAAVAPTLHTLPGPLAVVLGVVVLAAVARLIWHGRLPVWEPAWMGPMAGILLFQGTAILIGHGRPEVTLPRAIVTVAGLAVFVMARSSLTDVNGLRIALRTLAVGFLVYTSINSVLSWQTDRGYRFLEADPSLQVSAATTVGALTALYVPLCIGGVLGDRDFVWRAIYAATLLSVVANNVLTLTRGGLLGLAACLLAWIVLGRGYLSPRFLVAMVLVLASVLLIDANFKMTKTDGSTNYNISALELSLQRLGADLSGDSDYARWKIYRGALAAIQQRPIEGMGAGVVASHSLLLAAALDFGVVYLGCWLLLLLGLARQSRQVWRKIRGHREWGPLALGFSICVGVAILQSVIDTMLYGSLYAMLFWYMRGLESTLGRVTGKEL